MSDSVEVFILGYGDNRIQIPVFGLSVETKAALKYSVLPIIILAVRNSIVTLFSNTGIGIVYGYVLVVGWCGRKFSSWRNRQNPEYPFLGELSSSLVSSTCLYVLMLIVYNALHLFAEQWKLFLLLYFVILFIVVHRDTFQVHTLSRWLTTVIRWMRCVMREIDLRDFVTRRAYVSDGGESYFGPTRHSALILRDEIVRSMSQEINVPPPVRYAPPPMRRKVPSSQISPIRPTRSSHQ